MSGGEIGVSSFFSQKDKGEIGVSREKLVSGGNWCECVFSLTPLIYAGERPFALPAGAVVQLGPR